MTSRDRAIVLGLVALLVVLSAAISAPAFAPAGAIPSNGATSPGATSRPPPLVYREGIMGRPDSINPLTARTQAARDIVALVFSGLVRQGPNGSLVPDLAERWTIAQRGSVYTFVLRAGAVWQDGQPVTSADVAFTVRTLQDPAYNGPQASSWREVSVIQLDDRTVRFTLATPLGGFLQAATLPILPEHLLSDVAPSALATDRFSSEPIGSGPYRLVRWDTGGATLVPAAVSAPAVSPSTSSAPSAASSLSTSASPSGSPASSPSSSPAPRPSASPSSPPSPSPSVEPSAPPGAVAFPRIELHFYTDPQSLIADYRAGELDAASGLAPIDAKTLGSDAGSRIVRFPQTTFTGVVFNERVSHPVNRDARFRRALLSAIDRSKLVGEALGGVGRRADTPIPPASWAFDPTATPAVKYDPTASSRALRTLGWTKVKGLWQAPKTKKPFVISLVAPDKASNPIVFDTAARVSADWRALGFKVELVNLPVRDFAARLAAAQFEAAVVDIDVGLDPDLYPLFASSQTTTGGANVSGVQISALDQKLSTARTYAARPKRLAAFRDLQAYLGATVLTLPLFFRDSPFVVRDRVFGPSPAPISDGSGRYWDVLTWRLANGP